MADSSSTMAEADRQNRDGPPRDLFLEKAFDVFCLLNESVERLEKMDARISPISASFSVIHPLLLLIIFYVKGNLSLPIIILSLIWLGCSAYELRAENESWVTAVPLICQFFVQVFAGHKIPELVVALFGLVVGLLEIKFGQRPFVRFLFFVNAYCSTSVAFHGSERPRGFMYALDVSPLLITSYAALKGYMALGIICLFALQCILVFLHENRAVIATWLWRRLLFTMFFVMIILAICTWSFPLAAQEVFLH